LEIAMDDPLVVRLLERIGDLPGDGQRLVYRDRSFPETLGEILTRRQLHDEEVAGRAAREGRRLEAVQVGDAAVAQGGQQLRLALEPAETLRVGREGAREDLDRHVTAELGVAGPVHLAHAAGAERRDDLVVSQAAAGVEAHGGRGY